MKQRIEGAEKKQRQMMSFLAIAMQSHSLYQFLKQRDMRLKDLEAEEEERGRDPLIRLVCTQQHDDDDIPSRTKRTGGEGQSDVQLKVEVAEPLSKLGLEFTIFGIYDLLLRVLPDIQTNKTSSKYKR
ncbi:Uncharacterized protein Rs2_35201 [Raphanus sativus]|nr:Uncharacterized protein Rs2_35201 [Raphanus sativus]